jgi:sortase A
VLAGHRDSDFSGLADVRRGDRVRLETVRGSFTYEVSDVDTGTPDTVEVLDPTEEESLTLLTCYPFDWVGPAPRRLVVRAHRVGR